MDTPRSNTCHCFLRDDKGAISSTLKRGASRLRLAISYGTMKLASLYAWSRSRGGAFLAISKAAVMIVMASLRVFSSDASHHDVGGLISGVTRPDVTRDFVRRNLVSS